MMKNLEHLTHWERLRGLQELEREMGEGKEDRGLLFSAMLSERTRGSGHKLKYRKFHMNVRKKILYCEGCQTPEQVVPSLEILKTCLDAVLSQGTLVDIALSSRLGLSSLISFVIT